MTEPTATEPLAPAPPHSRWGRSAVRVYLALVAIAAGLTARELFAGRSGVGTWAVSVLTAPWSVLLAGLARALAPRMDAVAMRACGIALVVLAAALNARILYGMAARAERDARRH